MRQCRYYLATVLPLGRFAAVVCLVAALVGCSRNDADPPVAAITVTPGRARVAPGGLLDMTYRFVPTGTVTIPPDYRVFVHFTNADGEILWTDDHDPPVAIAKWRAGEPVQYTRTRFLPASGIPAGDITVRVGLYADNGPRLPLEAAAADAGDRAYPAASFQMGTEADRIFLIYTGGWHPEEFSSDGQQSWTWTQKSATVSFRNPRTDVTLLLEYDARPDVFPGAPQQVAVTAGGQPVTSFAAASNHVVLTRVPIPAAALGTAEMSEIRLDVDKVFVPADLPAGGKDTRPLGIRVYHAQVESR